MADQTAEVLAALQSIADTVTTELPEIKALIESIPTSGVDLPTVLAKVAEIKARISSMSDNIAGTTPVPGKVNVKLGIRSSGQSRVNPSIEYIGEDEDIIPIVEPVFLAGASAAGNQPDGGEPISSTLFLTVNGETREANINSLHPLIKAQQAVIDTYKAIVDGQAAQEGI